MPPKGSSPTPTKNLQGQKTQGIQIGKGEASNQHPTPPQPQEKHHNKTLPLPTKDGLHLPLMVSAGTSRALSQEPLPS